MFGFIGIIILLMSIGLVVAVLLLLPGLNKNQTQTPQPTVTPRITPPPGTTAAVTTVLLPGQKVRVPDLSRKTVQEAQEALKNSHLQVGEIRYDFSNEVEAGKVINTLPRAGNEVDQNTAVGIVVSRGRTT
jgi:hypothetical protein